ncbi:MAG: CPBP family intramembrane glutamic endopeptidase [Blastococcus sp.]
MRAAVRRSPVVSYVVLTYAWSWSWWIPMAVRGDIVRPGVGWPTHLPGLAGPAVAAVVVTALADGRPGLADLWARVTRWRVGWRWWWLVLGTAALALLGVVVALITGDHVPTVAEFASYSGIGRIGLAGVVVVAFLANGLGEETGWRGLAADRLLRDHSLTRTSFLVAAVWGCWHVPTFWFHSAFRSYNPAQFVGWAVGLAAGSVVLTWVYRNSGRSVLLVAALHTAFNLASATEATGFVVGMIASLVVIVGAVSILRREAALSSG